MQRLRACFAIGAVILVAFVFARPAASSDTVSKGGIITFYSASGANGTLTIRVSNPFTVAVTGYVNYSVTGGLADGNNGNQNYSLLPGATTTITVNLGGTFQSSTAGAGLHDSTNTQTATGWGNSTTGSCTNCLETE
jgi:hypothetical protein